MRQANWGCTISHFYTEFSADSLPIPFSHILTSLTWVISTHDSIRARDRWYFLALDLVYTNSKNCSNVLQNWNLSRVPLAYVGISLRCTKWKCSTASWLSTDTHIMQFGVVVVEIWLLRTYHSIETVFVVLASAIECWSNDNISPNDWS